MITEREALKLVYENSTEHDWPEDIWNAIKEALMSVPDGAQPEQEPVAYRSRMRNRDGQVITGWVVHLETTENPDPRVEIEPLYTTPPQRKPLTDEQIDQICGDVGYGYISVARAIEAAHDIKE